MPILYLHQLDRYLPEIYHDIDLRVHPRLPQGYELQVLSLDGEYLRQSVRKDLCFVLLALNRGSAHCWAVERIELTGREVRDSQDEGTLVALTARKLEVGADRLISIARAYQESNLWC